MHMSWTGKGKSSLDFITATKNSGWPQGYKNKTNDRHKGRQESDFTLGRPYGNSLGFQNPAVAELETQPGSYFNIARPYIENNNQSAASSSLPA